LAIFNIRPVNPLQALAIFEVKEIEFAKTLKFLKARLAGRS